MRIWDLKTRRASHQISHAHQMGILTVLQFDSSNLITHGRDGIVKLWDLNKIEPIIQVPSSSTKEQQQQYSFCNAACADNFIFTPDAANTANVRENSNTFLLIVSFI